MFKEAKEKNIVDVILEPFQRFSRVQASGGIVLLICTVIALAWANSPWSHYYYELWEQHLTLEIAGGKILDLDESILHWVNDGLMAIFFFVVGLEIKRELVVGELSSPKQASLPIAAAIGGMLLPAMIFVLVNTNEASEVGWGIPMATDIAFSLGILSLLGKRVPLALKVFLVAFAIVDDLGAVVVIALFYSGEIEWIYLFVGLGSFVLLIIYNQIGIRSIPMYMVVGWLMWFMFKNSGIHPTIAGVMIAFTIPLKRKIQESTFKNRMKGNLDMFVNNSDEKVTLTSEQLAALDNMEDTIYKVQSPVQSLEHTLNGFVTYLVMPLFALTNAGVVFKASSVDDLFGQLSGTIELSLIVGKVLGIFVFTWIAVKMGIAELPKSVKWVHILGLGFLGGMGFTMSLFISNLAYGTGAFLNPAKIGILVGSLIAGITGYILLRVTLKDKVS